MSDVLVKYVGVSVPVPVTVTVSVPVPTHVSVNFCSTTLIQNIVKLFD